MVKNTGDIESRLLQLTKAIKTVYASTFFQKSRDYLKATKHIMEEEKMAEVIQQIVGNPYDNYFYPVISGVGKSMNYYPYPGEKREDGIAMLCFGFGKAVVENISCLHLSPRHPKRRLGQPGSQTSFFALNIKEDLPTDGALDGLSVLEVSQANEESLRLVASTLGMETHELVDVPNAKGPKFITFNPILPYSNFPLAKLIEGILDLGSHAMDCPVEIEFAVNFDQNSSQFTVLQLRPIVEGFEEADTQISATEKQKALVYSHQTIGSGVLSNIKDIVMLIPEKFSLQYSLQMAQELEEFNNSLNDPYILIVSGRLGSSDHWLGIPLGWQAISNAAVIVETGLPGINAEPSQGSHFFQNLTGEGVIFLTCNPQEGKGIVDFAKLDNLGTTKTKEFFKHIHLQDNLLEKVNGRKSEAVILAKELFLP